MMIVKFGINVLVVGRRKVLVKWGDAERKLQCGEGAVFLHDTTQSIDATPASTPWPRCQTPIHPMS